MAKYLPYMLELAGATGMLFLFAFVSWTKLALGSALTVLGAIYPHGSADGQTGAGALKLGGINITLKGSLRIGVIVAGIIILIGELFFAQGSAKKYSKSADAVAGAIGRLNHSHSFSDQSDVEFSVAKENLEKMEELKPDPKVGELLRSIDSLSKTRKRLRELDSEEISDKVGRASGRVPKK